MSNIKGGRTLILCFDGTSNEFDNENTNIIKFFDLLKKYEPEKQMVYYQPGVRLSKPFRRLCSCRRLNHIT